MRVLFLGNSYTFYNNMPELFKDICARNGVDAEVMSVTCGGYTIAHFVSNDNDCGRKAKELLKQYKFDYVVLQEMSVRPASNPETFLKSVREFMPYIRKNGARPALYQTWGRPDGSPLLVEKGWTHEEMHELLKSAYVKAAKEHDAIFVPAGDRLHEAYREGRDTYSDDGGHPSPEGSAIIAQAFFDALVTKQMEGSK